MTGSNGPNTSAQPSGTALGLLAVTFTDYALIMGSRKPEAKAFRKWVTAEVLPQVRRTGSYNAESKHLTASELLLAQDHLIKVLKEFVRRQEAMAVTLDELSQHLNPVEGPGKPTRGTARTTSPTLTAPTLGGADGLPGRRVHQEHRASSQASDPGGRNHSGGTGRMPPLTIPGTATPRRPAACPIATVLTTTNPTPPRA